MNPGRRPYGARPRTSFAAFVAGLTVFGSACRASHAGPEPVPRSAAMVAEPDAPAVAKHEPRLDSDASTYSACAAPSVIRLHGPDDSSDPAVSACGPGDGWARLANREQGQSARCDVAGRPGLLDRALAGALPLDAATRAHVRAVFQVGRQQARRPDAFGLVGDSMTVEGAFMRPFAWQHTVAPSAARALTLASGASVIDYFRDAQVADAALFADSFVAPRAAKVGAKATWPLAPQGAGAMSPLDQMIASVSPAYAVVLYGANDAVWEGGDTLSHRRTEFTAALSAIVEALEGKGIIAILTTIPKHMRYHGWPDCPPRPTGGSNERFAAQATALSAAVADVACQRHLPLVDLRWSLDALLDHGIGPDGLHLSVHPSGGAVLDAAGLQCGYNVRNLVTLRELVLVADAVATGVW